MSKLLGVLKKGENCLPGSGGLSGIVLRRRWKSKSLNRGRKELQKLQRRLRPADRLEVVAVERDE